MYSSSVRQERPRQSTRQELPRMKRARREETEEEEEESGGVRSSAFITARDQYVSHCTLCVWCTVLSIEP